MTRLLVLLAALLFVVGFGALTIHAVAEQGFSLGTAVSAFIFLMLAIGIIGAVRHPPD